MVFVLHTGSNTTDSAEYEAPETTPAPPTRPEARLSRILPYKLGMTITSNCCGLETICMVVLSTIIFSNWIFGYSLAIYPKKIDFSLFYVLNYIILTVSHDFKNKPSPSFMMFALWTAVTFLRLFLVA